MPAALRAILTANEIETLSELRKAGTVPYRVRDRAHIILLNASGWNAPALAEVFNCHEHTIRTTIKNWKTDGLCGLWESKGRGRKPTWQPADLEYLEACVTNDERTYNSRQLSVKLEQDRSVTLSADRIRRLLKKKISLEADSSESSQPSGWSG